MCRKRSALVLMSIEEALAVRRWMPSDSLIRHSSERAIATDRYAVCASDWKHRRKVRRFDDQGITRQVLEHIFRRAADDRSPWIATRNHAHRHDMGMQCVRERTVEIHGANVMEKMGARSVAHLVKMHLMLVGEL
jgi:FixJ family two-component response regulator